jgi:tetratricopeptide (TPR) repeat protein
MGYLAVGLDYSSLNEAGRAREYFSRAFQLREHADGRERLAITATYYKDVTGELDKAARTYQEEIETYPREPEPYGFLGIVYSGLGQYGKPMRSRNKSCPVRRI